ncbi:MAG: substrate-binding domain-containing protein [Deltaproteobacteria bacterium]|nr:substrate-binding domain-containing protein [Deltaproteobacteria bacterium]
MDPSSPSSGPRPRPDLRAAALLLLCTLLPVSQALGAEVLRIGGTGAAMATFRILAQEFAKTHPGVTLQMPPSLGSSGGLKALIEGQLDLALSARVLREEEAGHDLTLIEIGRSPLAFAVSTGTPLASLRLREVAEIYEGKRRTWPGGLPIRLVLRPAGDADTVLLKAMSPRMSRAVGAALERPGMVVADNDQDNAAFLETLPGAFGTTVVAQIRSERRALTPLVLDGVAPTPEALLRGHYPYARNLYVALRKQPSALVEAFVGFVRSHTQTLTDLGYIPSAQE